MHASGSAPILRFCLAAAMAWSCGSGGGGPGTGSDPGSRSDAGAPQPLGGGDWTQYRHDPSGVSANPGIWNAADAPAIAPLWTAEITPQTPQGKQSGYVYSQATTGRTRRRSRTRTSAPRPRSFPPRTGRRSSPLRARMDGSTSFAATGFPRGPSGSTSWRSSTRASPASAATPSAASAASSRPPLRMGFSTLPVVAAAPVPRGDGHLRGTVGRTRSHPLDGRPRPCDRADGAGLSALRPPPRQDPKLPALKPTACCYLPRPAAAKIRSAISFGWETKER
jgi:hypothetical protein